MTRYILLKIDLIGVQKGKEIGIIYFTPCLFTPPVNKLVTICFLFLLSNQPEDYSVVF